MSITLSIPFPDGLAQIDGTAPQRQVGLACVVGVAWIGGFPAGTEAPAGQAEAGRSGAEIDLEPQVYCLRRGIQHAAQGFAPCSDLGCTGCARGD